MKIAILGIGAIGSYIAAMFSHFTEHELYLLARSNFSVIEYQGITIEETSSGELWKAYPTHVENDIHGLCCLIQNDLQAA